MCINIAITDDHPMIANGIATMLDDVPEVCISDIYSTGKALMEGLTLRRPDLLFLDIRLPDIQGENLAKDIRRIYPQQKIIIITGEDNPYLAKEMLRLGCLGYLLKSADKAVLRAAVETVYKGDVYIDAAVQQLILNSVVHLGVSSSRIHLTQREQEILSLLCEGLNSQEIAGKLFLSHRTIEAHRHSLNQKFDVKNSTALVKKALQQGWIK